MLVGHWQHRLKAGSAFRVLSREKACSEDRSTFRISRTLALDHFTTVAIRDYHHQKCCLHVWGHGQLKRKSKSVLTSRPDVSDHQLGINEPLKQSLGGIGPESGNLHQVVIGTRPSNLQHLTFTIPNGFRHVILEQKRNGVPQRCQIRDRCRAGLTADMIAISSGSLPWLVRCRSG